MNTEIIVAIVTGAFTLAGVVLTVLAGNKKTERQIKNQSDLTLYRIDQLEKKQDEHNGLIERMYKAEDRLNLLDERTQQNTERITDLERRT